MTDETKAEVERRYRRGQSLTFIRLALDIPISRVREVLRERGVEVKPNCKRNRAWGYRGGY